MHYKGSNVTQATPITFFWKSKNKIIAFISIICDLRF